ncbi:MAG: hypothetical protein LUF85_02520 [Bacteroides sp.]|nr:hypothetical protein [Bacteroides sp.]
MDKLSGITGLKNKSLWRRLRGEYKFSLDEMFNICPISACSNCFTAGFR